MGAFLIYNTDTASQILSFDIVVTENPTFPTQITEHVVEQGADVTDNIRVGLISCTLEVFVSNEPLFTTNQFGSGAMQPYPTTTPATSQALPNPALQFLTVPEWFTLPLSIPVISALTASQINTVQAYNAGLPPNLGGPLNPQVLQFPSTFDAVQQTHDTLDLLRTTAALCSVYGTKATYDNMAIENFSMQRDKDTGSGATFTIQMKQVRMVTTSIVAAPVPTKPRGASPTNKGSASGTGTTPGVPLESAWSLAFGALFPGQSIPQTVNPPPQQ